MPRFPILLAASLLLGAPLTGCGLAETGAAAAAAGASQAEQIRQGKETEARVKQQLDAAAQQNADRMRAAESDSR